MLTETRSGRTGSTRIWRGLLLLTFFTSLAAAQDPGATPEAGKASGVFPIVAQSSLVIRGIPGQIVVTTKPTRELKFTSKAKDRSGGERPIAVELGDTAVTMTSPPGGTVPDGILRVEAPSTFSVRVEAQDGTVVVDGFAGSVALVGKGTVLRAQAITGPIEASAEGGSLNLTNLGGKVTAKVGAKTVISATDLRGELDLNSRGATFKIQGVAGYFRLDANGGSGEVTGLASGGDLRLVGAGVRLTGSKGEITVASDAGVDFQNMTATLRFEMDGGMLRGRANQGSVRVRTRRTDVKLEGITGELDIDTQGAGVSVTRITGAVNAVVFGGDAHLQDIQGPVQLDIGTGNAEVAWAAIAPEADSLLKSNNGDITVRFPANASCRVTARSSSGHITSDIPTIKVQGEATEVQGALGQGQRPHIEIEADGKVTLSANAKAAAAS